MTVTYRDLQIEWLGYATVRIESPDGYVVYLDPGRYGVLEDYYARDGDLVCVTHDHHYDTDAIEQVAADDATVIVYGGIDADAIDRDVRSWSCRSTTARWRCSRPTPVRSSSTSPNGRFQSHSTSAGWTDRSSRRTWA